MRRHEELAFSVRAVLAVGFLVLATAPMSARQDSLPRPFVVAVPVPTPDRSAIPGIPDVLLSGVAASVLTLAGVYLTLRQGAKNLAEQLRHDADQRALERLSELRKDEAVKLIDAQTNALRELAELPKGENGTLMTSTIAPLIASATHYQMFGSREAGASIQRYVDAFGEASRAVGERSFATQSARAHMESLKAASEQAKAEADRTTELGVREFLTGKPDGARIAAVETLLKAQRDDALRQQAEALKAMDAFFAESQKLGTFVAEQVEILKPLRRELVKAIRSDFAIPDQSSTGQP